MQARPPALLTMASYYGTLAAARCLGARGISVIMAESELLAPARWSRHVSRRVACPSAGDSERFLDWLEDFGERSPGCVLYPTSDDLAWLFALRREALARRFLLYSPPVDAVYQLLNKKRLDRAAQDAGLAVPRSWFPEDGRELAHVGLQARFPVLIKPQTQVFFPSRSKGARADDRQQLAARYPEFAARNLYARALLVFDPGAARPMIQELHAEAACAIRSLSGFVDQTGELFIARAAVKVLQRPRKLGIGLCFEETAVPEQVASGIARLCRQLGYYGVFEAEFIPEGERWLLLDFNPRLFSQMAFDIARGVPLPLLAYLGAVGDADGLRAEVERARAAPEGGGRIYCHRFVLEVLLRGQTLAHRISLEEAEGWRRWWSTHRARASDAVADRDDPLPAVADLAQHLWGYARHPRAFLRSMVLDQ